MIRALRTWLAEAPAEPDVRALVLTGSGGVFCSGADIAAGVELLDDSAGLLAYLESGRKLADELAAAPLPVIAAVNGVAFAGGFELVLAADLVVAARSARLGDVHARHGLVPGWGSSARLPRIAGARAATMLLLTGADLSADELQRLGVVNEVVPDDALVAAVDALVERLAAIGPATLARVLGLARGSVRRSFSEALDAEWDALTEHIADPEFRRGIARFLRR